MTWWLGHAYATHCSITQHSQSSTGRRVIRKMRILVMESIWKVIQVLKGSFESTVAVGDVEGTGQ
jgi:hypothetical protein